MRLHSLKPGDKLYDCRRERAGNTMCRVDCTWVVVVLEMTERGAMVSWNGNAPSAMHWQTLAKLRRAPKEWQQTEIFGPLRCHLCGALKGDGHRPDCPHPKAVAARKKATASQTTTTTTNRSETRGRDE